MKSLLSSVEVLVLPSCDEVLTKEGLQKFCAALSLLNQRPSLSHVAHPIPEIRPCFIENKSGFFRQNIFLGEYFSSDHFALINGHFLNPRGLLKVQPFYSNYFIDGPCSSRLKALDIQVKNLELSQQFNQAMDEKKSKSNLATSFSKINVFINDVWMKVRSNGAWDQSVVVVSSSLEFKKLKEIFKEKGSPVGYISEHSTKQKVQSVIAKFNSGAKKHILISERAMYFNVLRPKRFKHLIFFSVPQATWIFEELVETLLDFYEYRKGKTQKEGEQEEENRQRLLLCFAKKEFYELERIVGTIKALDFFKSTNMFKRFTVL